MWGERCPPHPFQFPLCLGLTPPPSPPPPPFFRPPGPRPTGPPPPPRSRAGPSTWAAHLPPPFGCPTTPTCPFARMPEAREGRGCVQGEGRAGGVTRKEAHASGEDRTQGDRARGTGAQNDGRCNPGSKRWRREGRASRARHNPGKGCCVQAERGAQPSRGAARERKAARTISAPPHSVDRLRQI